MNPTSPRGTLLVAGDSMPMSSRAPRHTSSTIGKLCVGADWACSNGDFEALRHVARSLAAYTEEPLHCELMGLADACASDPEHAVEQWMRIKDVLFRS